MRIETTMSDSIKNLATAQVKVQQEIADMPKDSKGYGYNYTSYDALVKYLRPLLTKHGISFVQMPVGSDAEIGVETLYMHTSGEWIRSSLMTPIAESKQMNIYQSVGSAITYFRRYSLSAFVGIASDEDNDIQTIKVDAKPIAKPTATKKTIAKNDAKPISDFQKKTLMKLANDIDAATLKRIQDGIDSNKINESNLAQTYEWLDNKMSNKHNSLSENEVKELFS